MSTGFEKRNKTQRSYDLLIGRRPVNIGALECAERKGRNCSAAYLDTVAASPPPFDGTLCDALASGEAWAAAAIYHRVARTVHGVLYRILGDEDSERTDLAQEAFERVIASVTSGRFARSCDLRNWSAVIAKHVALDALRKRKRERKLFAFHKDLELDTELNVPSPTHTPEKALEVRRRLERVAIALQSMQKVRAEAFVLYNVLGYDIAAIARMTGVSVAAAQSRMVRGRGDVLKQIREQERSDK